jgi:hypothetical protein
LQLLLDLLRAKGRRNHQREKIVMWGVVMQRVCLIGQVDERLLKNYLLKIKFPSSKRDSDIPPL